MFRIMFLMPVTLKVCTSIVSISSRGEEEIIFLRWKGTHLTGRCSSSNSLGDWYDQNLYRARPPAVGYHILEKFKVFHAYPERVVRRSRMTVTGMGGTDTDTGMGTVLLVSISEGVRLTTSSRQVSSIFPPGKYQCRSKGRGQGGLCPPSFFPKK